MQVKLSVDSRWLIDNIAEQESMYDVQCLNKKMDPELAGRAVKAFQTCISQLQEINIEHEKRIS